jgi:hypothetical protein
MNRMVHAEGGFMLIYQMLKCAPFEDVAGYPYPMTIVRGEGTPNQLLNLAEW